MLDAVPDYRADTVRNPIRPLTFLQAVGQLTRDRVGMQKDVATRMGCTTQYISALLTGKVGFTPEQMNKLLDACAATQEERTAFNRWGAIESGWEIG